MTARSESIAGYSPTRGLRRFVDASVALLRQCPSWFIRSGMRAFEVANGILFLTVVSVAVAGGLIVVHVLGGTRLYTRRRSNRIPLVTDIEAHY